MRWSTKNIKRSREREENITMVLTASNTLAVSKLLLSYYKKNFMIKIAILIKKV